MSSGKSKRKVEVGGQDSGLSEEGSSQRKPSVFDRLGRSTQPEQQDRQLKCRNWEKTGECLYGSKCHFRHEDEGKGPAQKPRRSMSSEKKSDKGADRKERRQTSLPKSERSRSSKESARVGHHTASPRRGTDKIRGRSRSPSNKREKGSADDAKSHPHGISTVVASKPSRFQADTDEEDDDEQELLRQKRAIQNELKKLQEEAAMSGAVAADSDFPADDVSDASSRIKQTQKVLSRGPCTPPPEFVASSGNQKESRPQLTGEPKGKPKAKVREKASVQPQQAKREQPVSSVAVKPMTKKRLLPSLSADEKCNKAKKRRLTPSGTGDSKGKESQHLSREIQSGTTQSYQKPDDYHKAARTKLESSEVERSSKNGKPTSAVPTGRSLSPPVNKGDPSQSRTERNSKDSRNDTNSSKKYVHDRGSRSPKPARSNFPSTENVAHKSDQRSEARSSLVRSKGATESSRWHSPSPSKSSKTKPVSKHASHARSPSTKSQPSLDRPRSTAEGMSGKDHKLPKHSAACPTSPVLVQKGSHKSASPEPVKSRKQERSRISDDSHQEQTVKPKLKVCQASPQKVKQKQPSRSDRGSPMHSPSRHASVDNPKGQRVRAAKPPSEQERSRQASLSPSSPNVIPSPVAPLSSHIGSGGSSIDGKRPQKRRESSHSESDRGSGRTTEIKYLPKASRYQDTKEQHVAPSTSRNGKDSKSERERSPAESSPGRSPSRSFHRHSPCSPPSPKSRSVSGDRRSIPRSPLRNDSKSTRLHGDQQGSTRSQRRYTDQPSKDKRYEDFNAAPKREDVRHMRPTSRSPPYKPKERSDVHSRGTKEGRHSPLLPPELMFPPLPPFYPPPHRDGDRALSPHRGFGLLPHLPFSTEFFKHDRMPYDGSGRSSSHFKEGRSLPLTSQASRYKERDLASEPYGRNRRSLPRSPGRYRDSSPQYHHSVNKSRPLPLLPDFRDHSPRDSLRLLLPPLSRDLHDQIPLPPRSPEHFRGERERRLSGESRTRYGVERKAGHDRPYERSAGKYDSPQNHGHNAISKNPGRLLPLPQFHEGTRSQKLSQLPSLPCGQRQLRADDPGSGRRRFGIGQVPAAIGRDGERSAQFLRGRGRLRGGRGTALGFSRDGGRRLLPPRDSKEGDKARESFRRLSSNRSRDLIRKRPRSPIIVGSQDGTRQPSVSPTRQKENDRAVSPQDRQHGNTARHDEKSASGRQRPRSCEVGQAEVMDAEPLQKRRKVECDRRAQPRTADGDSSVPDSATGASHDRLTASDRGYSSQRNRARDSEQSAAQGSPDDGRYCQDRAPTPQRSRRPADMPGEAVSEASSSSTAPLPPSRGTSPVRITEPVNALISSIADDELDSLISLQNDTDKDEQEGKAPADEVDIDWSSMMTCAGEALGGPAKAEEQGQPSRSEVVFSGFSPAGVLSRIGVSRVHAGDERFHLVVDCIAQAEKNGIGNCGLLDESPLGHVKKRLERASCQALLADIGPGNKALWARKDLTMRRKLARPIKTSVIASRSSCGAVDKDLVKLSLQLFAADPLQAKGSLSDVDVPT